MLVFKSMIVLGRLAQAFDYNINPQEIVTRREITRSGWIIYKTISVNNFLNILSSQQHHGFVSGYWNHNFSNWDSIKIRKTIVQHCPIMNSIYSGDGSDAHRALVLELIKFYMDAKLNPFPDDPYEVKQARRHEC